MGSDTRSSHLCAGCVAVTSRSTWPFIALQICQPVPWEEGPAGLWVESPEPSLWAALGHILLSHLQEQNVSACLSPHQYPWIHFLHTGHTWLRIYSSVPYGLSFTTVNGIIRTTLWPLDFSGSNSHRTRDLGSLSDQMFAGGCAKAPGELLCSTGNSKWVTMRQVQLPIHDPWGHTWPPRGCL